jgi:pyrroloquinoline-quinone synthase
VADGASGGEASADVVSVKARLAARHGVEPWSRDDFISRLRTVLEFRYHHLHPFNQRMHRGELSREELQRWVANRFYYQINIPIKDALILANCPEREVRQRWIERIIDHDGRPVEEGGIEAWLRLGEAMGVERETLLDQRCLLPGVRFAVDAYVDFCRSRPWLEAVAASLTELFAPLIVKERLAAILSHYRWVDPEGLQYFRNRLTQAPRDAEHALGLVTDRSRSRVDQDRAVAALEFKCDVLWSLLDSVERGPLPGSPV